MLVVVKDGAAKRRSKGYKEGYAKEYQRSLSEVKGYDYSEYLLKRQVENERRK